MVSWDKSGVFHCSPSINAYLFIIDSTWTKSNILIFFFLEVETPTPCTYAKIAVFHLPKGCLTYFVLGFFEGSTISYEDDIDLIEKNICHEI